MSIGSNGAAVDSMLKAMNSATTPDPTARLLGPVDAAALGREGKLTFVEALKASHCLDLAAAATPEGFAVSVRTAGLPDAERVRQQGGAEPQAPVVRRIDVQVPEHATLIIDPGFDLAVLAPGASDRKRLRTFLAITPRLGRELVEPAPRVYSRRPEPVPVP